MKKAMALVLALAWIALIAAIPLASRYARDRQADLFPKEPWIAPAHRVRAQAAKLTCEKYSLRPAGAWGGLMDGGNKLSLSFLAPSELTHYEARRLVALCMEDFLALVNADDEIRPYLCEYPLPPSASSIMIASPSVNAANASQVPYISLAWSFQGHVYIAYDDAESEHGTFKQVIKEPYEQALAHVKGENRHD